MRKEFLVERQGRTFCLYAGLLDLATQQGLKSIATEIVQIPGPDNSYTAICGAKVTIERDGVQRTFTGIGDAAPNNVAPAMQTCLLRMAETRAKARAMRDAVNIGMAAFEELPGDDEQQERPAAARSTQSTRSTASTRSTRAPAAVINTSGETCPDCHAPAGKRHGDRCPLAEAAA
jgi:hypothetical protein